MKTSLLLAFGVVLTGCVATDVGNPQTDPAVAQIEMEAFEDQDPRALTLDDGIEITHIWIAVDEVRLEPCEPETDSDSETETEGSSDADEEFRMGPVVADLVSGTTFPESVRLREAMTSFCGFSFEVAPLEPSEIPDAAPPELAGRSVLVRGTLKDGNPFVVHGTLDDTLELDGSFELEAEALTSFVLGFAVDGWLTQRQLGALTGDPILIDATSTPEIYATFEEAFVASPRLFAGEVGGQVVAE